MNLVLTNQTSTELPVMSKDEGGWCEVLPPNGMLTVQHTNSDVIIIGDKPDVTDVLKKTVKSVGALLKKLKDRIDGDAATPKKGTPPPSLQDVSVLIGNNGQQPIRVILGDGVTDKTVEPSASYEARAGGYIEIRELGDAPQQGGTPD
jgi:hypothetical protein